LGGMGGVCPAARGPAHAFLIPQWIESRGPPRSLPSCLTRGAGIQGAELLGGSRAAPWPSFPPRPAPPRHPTCTGAWVCVSGEDGRCAQAEAELRRLLTIMAALRDPATGCPWDKEQTFDTIAPYTIEEAYEVADSIARRDFASLPDELGDLLFQVVYHARMARRRVTSPSPTSPARSATR